jgi:hemerythrin-like domain-containing protein
VPHLGPASLQLRDNTKMLRDKNLVPLSRQHQHALALCVRINRAPLANPEELAAWQSEIQQHYEQEIRFHFAAEEANLFPAARKYAEFKPIVDELLEEHARLRADFARCAALALDADGIRSFAATLSSHIRKEERVLFEGMQQRMSGEELLRIGIGVDEVLSAAPQICIVPAEANLKKL